MNAPAAQPLWRMSLAGSELARIDMHPDSTGQGDGTVLLVFAVAQVRPAQAPRFGAGDDTAYLTGVVWRLEGAEAAKPVPAALTGRLGACELGVHGQDLQGHTGVPSTLAGPLTLTLCSALGETWTVQAQALAVQWDGAGAALPSMAC